MVGTIVGTIVIVAVTVVIGVIVDRRFGLLPRSAELAEAPRPATTHAAGEAPATAIRAGALQIARLRTGQRCRACRATMTAMPDDHARYAERDLLLLQFRCPRCDAKRTLYVAPAA